MKKLAVFAVLGVTFLLAGCDSEPSGSDIRQAMQENIDSTNVQAKARFGNNASYITTLNKAEKVSCARTGNDPEYTCKVDTDITLPFMGRKQTIAEFKFIKIDGKWKATS